MDNASLVENIMTAMKAEITKYGLEVLVRYPRDLLVHDRLSLERYAFPGAHMAWMVGHSHTHIAHLGLHSEENERPTYLTNLANDDRFYEIKVTGINAFSIKETTREAFPALSRVPILYETEGYNHEFYWLRHVRRGRLGTVAIESVGNWQEPKYRVTITPVAGISPLDRATLRIWAENSCVTLAHSLFVRYEIEEAESISLLAHAA